MSAQPRRATYADHSKQPPQVTEPGSRTWITRGANFVVAVSEVDAGAVLTRKDNPDEYWVILPAIGATVRAGKDSLTAGAESIVVVPAGPSSVTAQAKGWVARVFSSQATDLTAAAVNAATYADGAPEVAPIKPWPAPQDGSKLRAYKPFDFDKPDTNMRVFRSSNLMVNVMTRRTKPRDIANLTPHSHDDYEQGSLVVEGDYIHHLRWPWVPDMTQWRNDEAAEVGSPSVTIIPAKVIHTSRNVGPQRSWLIDIFGPPRMDFSTRPGFVLNEADYPMPGK